MAENLLTALEITIVGMGLVFGAIVLLWGVMALLVRLTAERPVTPAPAEAPAEDAEYERRRRAAVAAVSVALARERDTLPHAFPIPPTPIVSAWQAVMRGRLLQQKGPRQDPRR